MNDKPHLDVEALAELQDVMEDEFDVLIQTYLADSRSRIDGLREALATADPAISCQDCAQLQGQLHQYRCSQARRPVF